MNFKNHITEKLIEQLDQETPKLFLKKIKESKRYLFLKGNTFYSIPLEDKKEVFSWFQTKGIEIPQKITLSLTTSLGKSGSFVDTYPSFTGKKEIIIAFPKDNFDYAWSPLISNLNLFLKFLPKITQCGHDKQFLDSFSKQESPSLSFILSLLNYRVEHNFDNLNRVIRLKKELMFSTPHDGWILVSTDEINHSLLNAFLRKF